MRRLKRVFAIDFETCPDCGGTLRVIASIEDPVVIRVILAHLNKKMALAENSLLPDYRAHLGHEQLTASKCPILGPILYYDGATLQSIEM